MQKKKTAALVLTTATAAVGVGLWGAQHSRSSFPEPDAPVAPTGLADATPSDALSGNNPTTAQGNAQQSTAATPGLSKSQSGARIEQGDAPGSGEFSRADFFKPQDWGADLSALAAAEPQNLKFNAACKNHPRNNPNLSPTEWAEGFTLTQAQQRWPAANTHVIDWNQFWQVKDVGYQVSIRWNFETPPLYSVVGHSFAINSPDGYGAPAFPEKMQITWDEAKNFVQTWEKKILAEGGKPGTRTMSLAEKPFRPAEVSPQDIERAEYANGRVRAAQTGKMSCNTLFNDLSTLTCSCWF
ncbi:MAG: hypothetical protein FJY29_05375 [Betaproteobacteria bacterium]|nr:hypothetical protein [Betaproteobacteria bacterium]